MSVILVVVFDVVRVVIAVMNVEEEEGERKVRKAFVLEFIWPLARLLFRQT